MNSLKETLDNLTIQQCLWDGVLIGFITGTVLCVVLA